MDDDYSPPTLTFPLPATHCSMLCQDNSTIIHDVMFIAKGSCIDADYSPYVGRPLDRQNK